MRTPWRVGKYDDRCNGYEILSAGNAKIAVALYMGGTGAAKNCAELIVDRVNAFETDATIATLRAEVARLAKDGERLDWLDQQECGFAHQQYGDYRYYCEPYGRNFKKARETIDAAISAAKAGEQT